MVLFSRNRYRVDYVYEGRWSPDIRYIPFYEDSFVGGYSRCRDNPGLGPNQGFLVEKLSCSGGTLSGDLHGNGLNIAEGTLPTQRWPRVNASYVVTGTPSRPNPVMAAEVLSSTNPSKPRVNTWLSLVELRDFPKLFHNHWNDLIEGGVGNAYLSYQFGAAPIIGDLKRMFVDFPTAVKRRMNVLKNLQEKGFTCRKVQLDSQSGSNPPLFVGLDNRGENRFSIYGYETTQWSQRTWGYANWYLDEHRSIYTDAELLGIAEKVLRGTYGSPASLSNLWELLPWSWLFDWFGNVGDILSANNNVVGAHNDGMAYICVHTIARMNGYSSTHPQFVDPFISRYETKSRTAVPAVLSAEVPFLNEGQLSILTAIGTTRK